MSEKREDIVQRLLEAYSASYDIEQFDGEASGTIPKRAFCRYSMHSEKFVLSRKAKLWEMDGNEYLYLFELPELTEEAFCLCRDYAKEEGMKLVAPGPGHMYSYITAVFICDRCTPEAERMLKKCRIYKSFHFSLHGWMDFHTIGILTDEQRLIHNNGGREMAKFMKKILFQTKKGRGRL